MTDRKPDETLRDGPLKAVIWRNDGENGAFFSVTLAKTYKDDRGQYQDSHSFSGTDLLRVAELSRQAYSRVNELRRELKPVQENDDGHDLFDERAPDRSAERSAPRTDSQENGLGRDRGAAAQDFDRSRQPRRSR